MRKAEEPPVKITHRAAHEVDLGALLEAWSGQPLRERVRMQLRATRDPVADLATILRGFDEPEGEAFERLNAEVQVLAAEADLWEADAGAVARDVCARYAALLSAHGRLVEIPECHAALRGVLLSLAFLVARNRKVRGLAGIKKRLFRW